MIPYILLIWILIKLSAPMWCYILAAAGVIIKLVDLGVAIGKGTK